MKCLLFLFCAFSFAQTTTLIVKDAETKNEIPFVKIHNGTGIFGYTDEQGKFKIETKNEDYLIFSHSNTK